MTLVALVVLLWTASAAPQELDMSLSGLEVAPEDLCARGFTAANFCGNKLSAAPPCCRSFRQLHLYRNSIQELKDDWLAECSHLEELSVSANRMRRLPARLLWAAPLLRRLQASRNQLDALPPELLHNASLLQVLDLSHNTLVELPSDLLEKTSKLVELFLQANSLTALPENLLASCGLLRVLWLSRNRLAQLPRLLLAQSPDLHTVRLDRNLIKHIQGGTFDNNLQLRFLDLSSNQLQSLPTGLFSKLTSLERLELAGNQLSVLPPAGSLPPQSAVIDLSRNLLQTVEELAAFGGSRVLLDNNMWCQDLIPASQLGSFSGPGKWRWFEDRPVRLDLLKDGVRLNAAGLLDCPVSDAPAEHRGSKFADVNSDFNATDTISTFHKDDAAVESPIASNVTAASKSDTEGSEDDVTLDSKYPFTNAGPEKNTETSAGHEATSYYRSTIGGNRSTGSPESADAVDTPPKYESPDFDGTTQRERSAAENSGPGESTPANQHDDAESMGNNSPESTRTTEASETYTSSDIVGTTRPGTSTFGYSEPEE